MKIYINSRFLSNSHLEQITNAVYNIEITTDIENSYDCEAVFVSPDFINKENLSKYPSLKWIQLLTAGFDVADLNAARERKIIVTNAKGVYSIPIAEDVIAKILMLNKNIKHYLRQMDGAIWNQLSKESEIEGSTVGILGTGSIGQEIAKRIAAFNTHIIGYNQSGRFVEYFDEIVTGSEGLNSLLSKSDYVIVSLPLNKGTKFLINKENLLLMKENAIIINIARGEIINQDDLIEALENKIIKGAGLDVVYPEPLAKDSKLWKLDNVFITPHNSFSSPKTTKRLISLIIENLNNYINEKELKNYI